METQKNNKVIDDFVDFGILGTIKEILHDYIISNTENNVYRGELCYLIQYQHIIQYERKNKIKIWGLKNGTNTKRTRII